MLPRIHRLSADKDFSRLFSKGRVWNGRGLGIKAVKNGLSVSRIGFVVSTKVSKRAVVRNKIKRRMREVVRKHLPGLFRGADIAFIARNEAVTMEFADFANEILSLLIRSGLLEKPKA